MRRLIRTAIAAVGMSAALIAVACEERPVDGPSAETHSVTVDFGDGEEFWTAVTANWFDYTALYGEVNFRFEAGSGELPAVVGCVLPVATTIFPESWDVDQYLFFEYYSSDWESVADILTDFGGDIPYGDWQTASGTVSLTKSGTLYSGTAELLMYNLVDYLRDPDTTPVFKPLTVRFTNVPLAAASRTAGQKLILNRAKRAGASTEPMCIKPGRATLSQLTSLPRSSGPASGETHSIPSAL